MKIITVNNNDFRFELVKNKPMVSSMQIAETFNKRHDNLIRTIEKDEAFDEFLRNLKIEVSEYKANNNNKSYKYYLLDRDAFSYFVMGFTGAKAKKWKLDYIKAFNEMEKRLQQPQLTPTTFSLQAISEMAQTLLTTQTEIQEVKQDITYLKNTSTLDYAQQRAIQKAVAQKVHQLKAKHQEALNIIEQITIKEAI